MKKGGYGGFLWLLIISGALSALEPFAGAAVAGKGQLRDDAAAFAEAVKENARDIMAEARSSNGERRASEKA